MSRFAIAERALITIGTCLGALLATSPAQAYVLIGTSKVVVTAPNGAAATVDRSPFRLSVADASGRGVLSEVPNNSTGPNPLAPGASVEPVNGHSADQPMLYAPLAFLVGTHQSEQWQGGLWQGNELTATQGGVEFSAQRVVGARTVGDGVELTLSTDDPSGRELIVNVTPEMDSSFRVKVMPSSASGIVAVADSFSSTRDEAFYGFGGRHNALDQRGQSFYNWVEEENFPCATVQQPGTVTCSAVNGQPQDSQLFPDGPTAAYYVQSLFVSSLGYGFLLRQPQLSYWRIDSQRPDAWQTEVAAPGLDYTIATGTPRSVVGALSAISGRNVPPPGWALGPQTSRLVVPGNGVQPAAQQVITESDIRALGQDHLPIEAYDMFGWQDILNQPGGAQVVRSDIAQLHALGIHVLAYFPPFVDQPSGSGYTNPVDFSDAVSKGLVATTPGGAPFLFSEPNFGVGALLDFTNLATPAWWESRIRNALDLGFDGFMEDFGEQVQTEMRFHDGSDGQNMHNLYPLLYHATTRAILERYMHEHPDRQLWTYTRSGYSAVGDQPGSAASDNGNFPGDNSADWEPANGLPSDTLDMLNRGIGGAAGYTADIGGYNGAPDAELFTRWVEWATLSPYMRIHNNDSNGTSQPWSYDAQTLNTYRHYAQLREATKPYLQALWREFARDGIPLARPLWLEFPGDATAAKQTQEWTLGDEVLVAPVVTQSATSRSVYFPAGCWQDPETGQAYHGPSSVTVSAPVEKLPYFFRCATHPFAVPAPGSNGACRARLPFTFRVHQNNGRVTAVRVFIDGRRMQTLRRHRVRRVTITPPARSQFTVRIVAFTVRRKRVVSVRRYYTCAKGAPRTQVHHDHHLRRARS